MNIKYISLLNTLSENSFPFWRNLCCSVFVNLPLGFLSLLLGMCFSSWLCCFSLRSRLSTWTPRLCPVNEPRNEQSEPSNQIRIRKKTNNTPGVLSIKPSIPPENAQALPIKLIGGTNAVDKTFPSAERPNAHLDLQINQSQFTCRLFLVLTLSNSIESEAHLCTILNNIVIKPVKHVTSAGNVRLCSSFSFFLSDIYEELQLFPCMLSSHCLSRN